MAIKMHVLHLFLHPRLRPVSELMHNFVFKIETIGSAVSSISLPQTQQDKNLKLPHGRRLTFSLDSSNIPCARFKIIILFVTQLVTQLLSKLLTT